MKTVIIFITAFVLAIVFQIAKADDSLPPEDPDCRCDVCAYHPEATWEPDQKCMESTQEKPEDFIPKL